MVWITLRCMPDQRAPPPVTFKLRSRLALRLNSDIAACTGQPITLALLQAQRAILWVRHGWEVEARQALDHLHAQVLRHPGAELAAWLHLAEGLIAYYGTFGGGARDRVHRALVMASAAHLPSLHALAAAWLAQMDFVSRDIDSLVTHARVALTALGPADHGAGCRVGTALGMAWNLAQNDALAADWYAWARRHAVSEGDDASISAVVYNQAQMQALRIRHATLATVASEAQTALVGAVSVGHYENAVGGVARKDLTPLLQAQLLTVQGEFAAAVPLLEAQLPAAMAAGLARTGGSLLADLAWCWANTGETLRARALADQAVIEALAEADDPRCDTDERAALHARLAQVYALLGLDTLAAREADAATRAWSQDAEQRREWAIKLTSAGLCEPPR